VAKRPPPPKPPSALRRWALLVPHPPLSILYLLAIRHNRVHPRFAPLVVLAIFPVAALADAVRRLAAGPRSERGTSIAILCVAAIEIAWAVLALTIVGLAIGLKSG
jgi:hypothetical protein